MADTADTKKDSTTGVDVMIAGLAFQVFSLLVFVALCSEFTWKVYHSGTLQSDQQTAWNGKTAAIHIHSFTTALAVATTAIIIRSTFRVAELNAGFDGKLANEEVPFMILEGGMISLALIAMSAFHPGRILGQNWSIGKANKREKATASETMYKHEPVNGESETFFSPNTMNVGNTHGDGGVEMGRVYEPVRAQQAQGVRFEPVQTGYGQQY